MHSIRKKTTVVLRLTNIKGVDVHEKQRKYRRQVRDVFVRLWNFDPWQVAMTHDASVYSLVKEVVTDLEEVVSEKASGVPEFTTIAPVLSSSSPRAEILEKEDITVYLPRELGGAAAED